MNSVRRLCRCASMSIVALLALSSGAVSATSQRTFVASTGSDANACSLAQPCRSFAAAIAKTSANGEVIVLDSAGYGPVTITQSITITSPAGVYAGITVASGTGVTVNGAGIDVTLRGLTINSQGGTIGIHLQDGAHLVVDRCEIAGFSTDGVLQETGQMFVRDTLIEGGNGDGIQTSAGATIEHAAITDVGGSGIIAATGADVAVRDTSISGAGSNGLDAIANGPGVARTTVTLESVSIARSGGGVFASSNTAPATTYVDIVRSRISQTQTDGVISFGFNGGFTNVHVTDTLVSLNAFSGLISEIGGEMTVSGSTVVTNGNYGLDSSNNGIFTMQNNQVRDNTPFNTNGTVNPLGFN